MHIIIVGCGRVGAELARSVSRKGHRVEVIDERQQAGLFLRYFDPCGGLLSADRHLRCANERAHPTVCHWSFFELHAIPDRDGGALVASEQTRARR